MREDYVHDYKNGLAAARFYNTSGVKTDSADHTIDPLDATIET